MGKINIIYFILCGKIIKNYNFNKYNYKKNNNNHLLY